MPTLPDRSRPRLARLGPGWWSSAARLATRTAWRALHPALRGRYLEAPAPAPLTRLYYDTVDGWRAPLFLLPPAPGGSGEPVLIAHGLGVVGDVFRYGTGPTLADRLSAAGYAVYLLSHRGDRDAVAPTDRARRAARFDDMVEIDLPAAAERVARHSGFPRFHLVGFGLGGQLGLVFASRRPAELATVVSVGAPVRFDRPRTHLRVGARALSLLPPHWHVPMRAAARLSAPLVDAELPLLDGGASPGGRVRGVLEHVSDDVPVALLRQMLDWIDAGGMVSDGGVIDLVEAMADARVPMLSIAGTGDPLGTPDAARPAVERWGGGDATLRTVEGFGHLDLLLGDRADVLVFDPLIEWLSTRRRLAWHEDTSTVPLGCTA